MRGFEELSSTLLHFVEAFEKMQGGTPWTPGSFAAAECEEDPLADEWGPRPARDAWLSANLRITAGLDHLRGMAALLQAEKVVYATSTVARAALEAFAVAYYMGPRGITQRERVRRYMNVRLAGLHETTMMLRTIHGVGSSDELANHLAQCNRVEASARRQGFQLHRKSDRMRATYLGDQPPRLAKLCEAVVGAETGALGRVYYNSLSAVAHSFDHGLTSYLEEIDDGVVDASTGDLSVALGMSSKDAALRLIGAPLAAVSVAQEQGPLRGWHSQELTSSTLKMLSCWAHEAEVPLPGQDPHN